MSKIKTKLSGVLLTDITSMYASLSGATKGSNVNITDNTDLSTIYLYQTAVAAAYRSSHANNSNIKIANGSDLTSIFQKKGASFNVSQYWDVAGNYTWVHPCPGIAATVSIYVYSCGGGGGGGSGAESTQGYGGGSGGGGAQGSANAGNTGNNGSGSYGGASVYYGPSEVGHNGTSIGGNGAGGKGGIGFVTYASSTFSNITKNLNITVGHAGGGGSAGVRPTNRKEGYGGGAGLLGGLSYVAMDGNFLVRSNYNYAISDCIWSSVYSIFLTGGTGGTGGALGQPGETGNPGSVGLVELSFSITF